MRKLLIGLFILVCCASAAFSIEIKLVQGFGNMAFDTDKTEALSDDSVHPAGTFSRNWYPFTLAQISGNFKSFGYGFGFAKDPLLRNRIFANVSLEEEYFYFTVGPVVGIVNSHQLPVNPGVSGTLGVMYPGVVFAEASGSASLAVVAMDKKGNYSQVSADLSAGFWVPHVICSFNMSIKKFSLRKEITLLTEDNHTRYYFRADAFTKNFPYTICIDLGYQSLKRSYTSTHIVGTHFLQSTITDEFRSIFVGIQGTFTLTPGMKLLAGGEMPVYYWSTGSMENPSKGTAFFDVKLGMILTLPFGKNKKGSPAD